MQFLTMLVVSLVVGGFAVAYRRRQESLRRAAMTAWAASNGWSIEPDEGLGELSAFASTQRGGSRRALNVLRHRRDGLDLVLCDYTFVTGSGRSRTRHQQTLCLVSDASAGVPTFFLRRQVAVFDALGKLFGGQDVDFEEDLEFSSRYVLQSQDGDASARQAFRPAVRLYFTERAADRIVAEGAGGKLLVHWGVFVNPEELHSLVKEAVAIHRLWR